MANEKILRLKRYSIYTVQWIWERIHGLDFTMRDMTLIKKSGGIMHGYAKTDDAHVRDILNSFDISQKDRILDIGCGKGVFLRETAKYPFGKIAGIEIDKRLVEIAEKNFRILKLSNRIKVYCSDALKFENYGAFNMYYLANPFKKEIMEKVVDKIMASQAERKQKYYIVLYNPTCAGVLEEKGGKLIKKLYDKMKSYETYIYEFGDVEG